MDSIYQIRRYPNLIFLAVVLSLTFSVTGCGSSYEERQAKKETERKELIRKEKAKEKREIDQITKKHNAVYFPPEDLDAAAFTYELQKFFNKHSDKPIVFKGYLEDIEEEGSDIIVEFICPLGENYFLHHTAIRFRLTVSESRVKQFLEVKREDPLLHSLRYFYGPDYFVVARINNLTRSRRNEFDGSANGDEVEINVEVPPSFVSDGQLIEAIIISKDRNATDDIR